MKNNRDVLYENSQLISVYEDDNSSVLNKLPIKLCTFNK